MEIEKMEENAEIILFLVRLFEYFQHNNTIVDGNKEKF